MRKIFAITLLLTLCLGLVSCGASQKPRHNKYPTPIGGKPKIVENPPIYGDKETQPDPRETGLKENDFISTKIENISTFSANVNTATYTYFRKLVDAGYSLNELKNLLGNSLRTEEMVNYFKFNLNAPDSDDLFGRTVQIAPSPWNANAYVMMLGLKTKESTVHTKNNLVFLIDVSGSMASEDKLPLLKKTFKYLVEQLGEDDVISIVTYSGEERVVLEGCKGSKREKIIDAINNLSAFGMTNGESGILEAYRIAQQNFIEGGNNRIILATDGDLNVGISNPQDLRNLISQKRETGVYLSVLGFGTGNYRDDMLEAIAHDGNGIYYYVDGEAEAEKIFTTDLFSNLYTIANDVKLQINFNPDYINKYRLIGYETRKLNVEDFDNDQKDAGEVGTGHSVVVFYELVLHKEATKTTDPWMKLSVRYKKPGETTSILNEYEIGKTFLTNNPNDDFNFACAVIETSMIIIDSKYKGYSSLETVLERLSSINLNDNHKKEFKSLIEFIINSSKQRG